MKLPMIFCLLTMAPAMFAQSRVDEPIAGYVFDRELTQIKPLGGIFGAATVRQALDAGAAISQAAVSPSREYALAIAAGEAEPSLFVFGHDGVVVRRPLPGVLAAPARIALSPTGTA